MFVSPMLAQTTEKAFNNDEYIAELKLDGFRCVLSYLDDLHIYTRHKNEVTTKFPELAIPTVEKGSVLDGEIVVLDSKGKPDFTAVMKRLRTRKTEKIERLTKTHPVQYVAFDILYHRGEKVTHLPLMSRKALLETAVKESDYIAKVRFVEGQGLALFNAVKKNDLEGIMLKLKDSRYEQGKRSKSWQKVINYTEADVHIIGYRKNEFGWLIGMKDNGKIKPAGILELAIGPNERKAFYPVANSIKVSEDDQFVYLHPDLKCHVKFRQWTKNGYMRHPVFQGFCL